MICDECKQEKETEYDFWFMKRLCSDCRKQRYYVESHQPVPKQCECCGNITHDGLTLVHFEIGEETRECDIWVCDRCNNKD